MFMPRWELRHAHSFAGYRGGDGGGYGGGGFGGGDNAGGYGDGFGGDVGAGDGFGGESAGGGDGYGGGDYSSDFMGPPGDLSNDFMGAPEGLAGEFGDYSADFMGPPGDLANNFMGAPAGLAGMSSEQNALDAFLGRLAKYSKNMAISNVIGQLSQVNPVLGFLGNVANTTINSDLSTEQATVANIVNTIAAPVQGPISAITGLANLFGANINVPNLGRSIATADYDYQGVNPGESGLSLGAKGAGSNEGGSMLEGLGGLAQLYGAYKNYSGNQNYLSGLQNMYGQNSPYAQQLRQQLSRRDAAAGRRSQYGPREVELQAKLAQMASGVAPSILQGQQNQWNNQMSMLQQLGALQRMGAFNGLQSGLQNLWGSFTAPQEGSMDFMGPPSWAGGSDLMGPPEDDGWFGG